MTCRQLGGACDKKFTANTFHEIAEMSKAHGKKMLAKDDLAHIMAMRDMQDRMRNPEAMKAWFEEKQLEFEMLPDTEEEE